MVIDVVLMAALADENRALVDAIEALEVTDQVEAATGYKVITLKNDLKVVVAPPFLGMGQLNAAVATAQFLRYFEPRLVLLGGIAACLKTADSGFLLGDLVISDEIVDSAPGKVTNDGIEPRFDTYPSNQELRQAILSERNEPPWAQFKLANRPPDLARPPKLHHGDIFSGNNVVAADEEKYRLLSARPRPLAIEMEGAGITAMLDGAGYPQRVLVAKSFSDWADGKKNDAYRAYACSVSACYLAHLLTASVPNALRRLRRAPSPGERFKMHSEEALRTYLIEQKCPEFLAKMAESISAAAIDEISSLTAVGKSDQSVYSARVAAGEQYLLRARPLFTHARKIIATSIDTVSRFWIDPRNSVHAKEYLSAHTANLYRLFVFSTPESAHQYAKRLDFHTKKFPNTLICSKDDYVAMLRDIAPSSGDRYLKKDFAVLQCDVAGREQPFFADLNDDTFSLRAARVLRNDSDVDYPRLDDLFEKLGRLQPGQPDPDTRVLKWEHGFWKHRESWAQFLSGIFDEVRADVFHLVEFDVTDRDYEALRVLLADVKYEILNGNGGKTQGLAERFGISEVSLVKRIERDKPALYDSVVGAQLRYERDPRGRYMLMMRFSDSGALDNFMRDEAQLGIRLKLFEKLGGTVADFARTLELRSPANLRTHQQGKLFLDALESMASSHMRRFDYRGDELISEMVRIAPPDF